MGEIISCKNCTHYIENVPYPGTGYCKKLGKIIVNPLKPPCDGLSFTPKAERSKIGLGASTIPSLSSGNVVKPSYSQPSIEQIPYGLSKIDYAPTGIRELDIALRGGFLRGKTYLVAGETGCGKTIFSIQFLINGVYHYNENGIYLAIDEPASHVVRGLMSFGWDVKDLIERKKLLFLDMRPHFRRLYLKDKDKRIDPKTLIKNIIKYIEKINAKRLVIDPIAPLMYGGQEDVLYAREFLREIVFELEKIGDVTTIMTSEIPTGSNKLSRFGVEEFLASGIIVLSLQEFNGRIYRIMYIRKARWAPVEPVKYVFEIKPRIGIVLKGPLYKVLEEERGFRGES